MNLQNITWTKNDPPIAQKALKEMRFIVDGIMDGTLAHEQDAWHTTIYKRGNPCGTAHCVAGWCELIGKRADKQKKSFFRVNFLIPIKKIGYYFGVGLGVYNVYSGSISEFPARLENGFSDDRDAYTYTRDRWGLTHYEANTLFDGENTKRTINAIVKKFEAGYRMML